MGGHEARCVGSWLVKREVQGEIQWRVETAQGFDPATHAIEERVSERVCRKVIHQKGGSKEGRSLEINRREELLNS